MENIIFELTVFFQEPFWVGIYQRESDGKYEVCKITFGAEPKDYEVHSFMLENYSKMQFSPSMEVTAVSQKRMNPKRMQRKINKQLQDSGVGTKAQQALKLQQEQCKMDRKAHYRIWKDSEKQRKFQLNQEKRKEKHKGH